MGILKKIKDQFYRLFIAPYYRCSLGSFGKDSFIFKPTAIDGKRNIFIGNGVIIADYGWLAAVPHTGKEKSNIKVGDGTYIGRFCHIYATSLINIGRKVIMADKVYISDNLHGYEDINKPVIDQPIMQTMDVSIGEGSCIGENVFIIGTVIGRHCIIGANAVVTKNIPDHSIAIGVPAKITKRFNFETKHWQKTNAEGEFI